jgi:glycoprotein endo-alpha-1,2-mannosidase
MVGAAFIPGVIPGYNDRAVRLVEDHFVIPGCLPAGVEGSTFREALKQWVEPFIGHWPFMFNITSWNEWNEGTAIEPATETEPTIEDQSGDMLYTAGEDHQGWGCRRTEVLAEFLFGLTRSDQLPAAKPAN